MQEKLRKQFHQRAKQKNLTFIQKNPSSVHVDQYVKMQRSLKKYQNPSIFMGQDMKALQRVKVETKQKEDNKLQEGQSKIIRQSQKIQNKKQSVQQNKNRKSQAIKNKSINKVQTDQKNVKQKIKKQAKANMKQKQLKKQQNNFDQVKDQTKKYNKKIANSEQKNKQQKDKKTDNLNKSKKVNNKNQHQNQPVCDDEKYFNRQMLKKWCMDSVQGLVVQENIFYYKAYFTNPESGQMRFLYINSQDMKYLEQINKNKAGLDYMYQILLKICTQKTNQST